MLSQTHNGALAVAYAYDQAGNATTLTYIDGWAVDFSYDALSRVTAANDNNGTPRVLASIGYDRLSRRASLTYGNGTSAAYDYTPRGDLTDHDWAFTGGANANYDFTYNGVGQLLTESVSDPLLEWLPVMDSVDNYTANGLNQYTDIKGATPAYDGNGNMTSDHRGQSYVYDAENVLRSASGLAIGTASYDYWADGARRSKTYASVTSTFYYTGDQEIAEYSGATLSRRYVRLPGSVDEPLLMIDYTLDGSCTNASYATCEVWAHQNRLGSVVATTDSTGAVIEKYTYSSYGVSDDATGFPFRFTGQKLDPETGLYYYKARYYDPEVGRFLQTDPIGYEDQMNLYAYVGNDPVNALDPSGLATCADPDCKTSTIDSEINQGPAAIDSSLQGDPNGQSALVTFNNDDPNGASPNQPVATETALTVEAGIRESGVSSVNINSTTGGNRQPPSRHASSEAVDINRVNGLRVDDPSNAGAVSSLQGALAGQPNIRENFGPARNETTDIGRSGFATTRDRSGNTRLVNQHLNHIHAATQSRVPTPPPPSPRVKP